MLTRDKVYLVLFCLLISCHSTMPAQSKQPGRAQKITVLMNSDCFNGATDKFAMEPPRIRGKDTLKGKWNVRVYRLRIEAASLLEAESLQQEFPMENHTVWSLDGKLFNSRTADNSHTVRNNDFWCIKPASLNLSSRSIKESRQLWMGIDGSYFDGLYTIEIEKGGSTSEPSTKAAAASKILYILRATRASN